MLFSRKKEASAPSVKELSAELAESMEKQSILLLSLRALLQLIKEFALDIGEIEAADFKRDMDRLSAELAEQHSAREMQRLLEKYQSRMLAFGAEQKRYLLDRERELREVIDLMSRAIATFNEDNRDYNDLIYKHSEQMEAIIRLDDIKKIKSALQVEIDQIRTAVSRKQAQDEQQVEILGRKVSNLSLELKKVKEESLRDPLTDAYNRRAFDREIRRAVEGSTLSPAPFALLLIDIDDFKGINDTYGHQLGDRVLISLSHKCAQLVRSDDFFARYGGEEFALILPGASLRNAAKKARQICKAIAATRYATDDAPGSSTISLTVSIGVSALRKGDSVSALIDRADKALYQAKAAGKNRAASE